jgi:thioredoxin reductase
VLKNGEMVDCDVLFVNEGNSVNADLLEQLNCNCTKKGAAVTDRKQQTNVEGVYVAGDASYDMHFVVVAAAEGVKAGVAIHNDLQKIDNVME